jgi:GTP cyclohydrolase IA
MESNNPENSIIEILRHLGENPDREGLKDTPSRVVKSWKELYGGYTQDPSTILTTFTDCDGYQQVVILRNIKLFSMCEHHMLPFYGKAHVAYLPDKKVIGISKLARLVDIYARRLQIQERLGQQITHALMEHLKPLGAACIIEASHMCMQMRGCNKQEAIMTTSSLEGVFLEDPTVRAELYQLLKL